MISPVFFEMGPLSIRWYGVMAAAGALSFYGLMNLRSKRYDISASQLGDIMFIIMGASIVGARLFYVIRFWNQSFAARPFTAVFKVWEGGLVFQGGFILAAASVIGYALWKKIPIGAMGDIIAPALPLGHALGRIGCFINGCCYGFSPYEGPGAVHYPFSPDGHFPVQLVESAGNVVLCIALLACERFKIARNKLFLLYLMGYTALRFCNEPLRGDYPLSQQWHGLTPGQYHALWQFPLVLAVFLALTWNAKRKRKHE